MLLDIYEVAKRFYLFCSLARVGGKLHQKRAVWKDFSHQIE